MIRFRKEDRVEAAACLFKSVKKMLQNYMFRQLFDKHALQLEDAMVHAEERISSLVHDELLHAMDRVADVMREAKGLKLLPGTTTGSAFA